MLLNNFFFIFSFFSQWKIPIELNKNVDRGEIEPPCFLKYLFLAGTIYFIPAETHKRHFFRFPIENLISRQGDFHFKVRFCKVQSYRAQMPRLGFVHGPLPSSRAREKQIRKYSTALLRSGWAKEEEEKDQNLPNITELRQRKGKQATGICSVCYFRNRRKWVGNFLSRQAYKLPFIERRNITFWIAAWGVWGGGGGQLHCKSIS